MRWRDLRRSGNVEDRRGRGGLVAGGGVGVVVIALIAMFLGVDPGVVLQGGQQAAPAGSTGGEPPAGDEQAQFVSAVLGSTEDSWSAVFSSQLGRPYQPSPLVLFTGAVRSACGTAQSAVGPFYCPLDRKVYIDLGFFEELRRRFQAPGDFAQAYVIAHEVGHHVQTLMGVSDQVRRAQQSVGQEEANALSVRLELQADCFAGVWANRAEAAQQILEQGDVEEALAAASAIGDDRLQMQSQGYVAPESFTHGTAEQRARWFRQGLQSGEVRACDTFTAREL